MRVGVDTGGTFTDVVAADGRITKVPSTPGDPGYAVRSGVAELLAGALPELLAHGTTVATNALLERKGAVVTLVTNRGFADVVEIARQDRPSLYDPWADRPRPLVDREHRVEVGGRLGPDGSEVEPVDSDPPVLPADTEAVAVCLLHSDLDHSHERAVADRLIDLGFDVSSSHEVSPQFREYERTVTTMANAYLRPVCRSYLRGLAGAADEVMVMTSAAGLVPIDEGADIPVSLLLSGPAGGVLAAAEAARAAGWPDAVTFDMGGTSTDVCLVIGGVPEPAGERSVAGFPIRMPSLDVHTIGAGGGSIAGLDPGGALAVGPRSAGAVPGPACYGLGGVDPTVTDADLVAGRILVDAELPGLGRLDLSAARAALDAAGVAAEDVITVVDAAMEQAVRAVSVARGVDPSKLALVAFGGAGPLHACAIADALGMAAVVVPARAGVLSAVGCLTAPRQHDLVRTWPGGTDHTGLDEATASLATEVAALVGGSRSVEGAGDRPTADAEDGRPLRAGIDRDRGEAVATVVDAAHGGEAAGAEAPGTGEPSGVEPLLVDDAGRPVTRAAGPGRRDLADAGEVGVGEPGPGGVDGVAGPAGSVEVTTSLECRYQGQSHEIRVSDVDAFPAAHEQRNGYARPGTPIEVVAIRATARLRAPLAPADLPVVDRSAAVGPAVIVEPDCTVWVPDGWRADPHLSGALVLTRTDLTGTGSNGSGDAGGRS